jgi:enoyl-CoA hydratase/carnithine racemase
MSAFANIELTREGDVVELRFHTRGGPLEWNVPAHRDTPTALATVAADPTVKCVIVTGTGDRWCTDLGPDGFAAAGRSRLGWEWARALQSLLAIEVPVIGVVNGPASIHAEVPVLADIVLAADDAWISDGAHFSRGVVPGDGAHLVWPYLLGPRRGKYFLLTEQRISAQECVALGVVNEIHPRASLHERAHQIADGFAARPIELLRYTRELLNLEERDRLRTSLVSHGLAAESVHMLETRDRAAD